MHTSRAYVTLHIYFKGIYDPLCTFSQQTWAKNTLGVVDMTLTLLTYTAQAINTYTLLK